MSNKIIYVVSHPIQYFSPLFKEINKEFDGLEVWYGCDKGVRAFFDQSFDAQIKWDIPLLEGYQYQIFKNYGSGYRRSWNFFSLFNPGMIWSTLRLAKGTYVIVHGWGYLSFILVLLIGRLRGIKVFVKGDSNILAERNLTWIRRILKKCVLGVLFRFGVNGAFYIGKNNKEFYEYYGMPDRKLHFVPMGVDNSRFEKITRDRRNELLRMFGWSLDSIVFFYTGKLSAVKNVSELTESFLRLKEERAKLVIVGDGPLKGKISSLINQGNGRENIKLLGFVNQREIVSIYQSFDVFVMSSKYEPWGLSVNEAMAAGRPVILSNVVGCADDLVEQGVNGFIYESGNQEELTRKMSRICQMNNDERENMGVHSKRIIENYSYAGHISAVKHLISS